MTPASRAATEPAPPPVASTGGGGFDAAAVRAQFPALARPGGRDGRPVAYLDSAATSQKPQRVLDALTEAYADNYGAIARGVYRLSAEATRRYEGARASAARFVGAGCVDEIVFVRGTTEAINLVAASWGAAELRAGDEILVTGLEHHSNLVPWQVAAERAAAHLVVAPVDDRGDVPLEAIEACLATGRVRLVAVAHVSNALGTRLPVAEIARLAHAMGALVLVDGAQSAPRMPIDVGALGCDFFAFSGHKAYAPNGIGVLWGRRELLARMPPYQTGGGMIGEVTIARSTFAEPPQRFEAGTPVGPEAQALAVALDWLGELGLDAVERHERPLLERACAGLDAVAGARRIGTTNGQLGVVSFVIDGAHAHDIGTVLDAEGVAVRAGHHCAQPLMRRFGVDATVRASLGVYSNEDDVDRLIAGVRKAARLFAR